MTQIKIRWQCSGCDAHDPDDCAPDCPERAERQVDNANAPLVAILEEREPVRDDLARWHRAH